MLNIIVWLGMRFPFYFIKLLAKLEYNNYIYLKKLYKQAIEDKYYNLAVILHNQAKEEYKHGKILSCLIEGKDRFILDKTGYWQHLFYKNRVFYNYYDKSEPAIVSDTGSFVSLNGVSQRYTSARWFFNNKRADEYFWEDKLAYMSVLEKETVKLYQILSKYKDSPLQRIATKFAKEEHKHQSSLYYSLFSFTTTPNYYIDKWKDRLFLAKLGLFVDITYFLYKNTLNIWQTKRYQSSQNKQ